MANNDFLTKGEDMSGVGGGGAIVMPGPQPSSGTNFLSSFVQGIMNGGKDKQKKEEEKLTFYTSLREAGYSAEEASARVNKQFSGTYLDKILGKNAAGFQAPSSKTDTFTSKSAKDKASAAKDTAMAGWYSRRPGESSKNSDKMKETMNQLQTRLKFLTEDMSSIDDPQSQAEIKAITKKIRAVTMKMASDTTAAEDTSQGGDQSWGNPDDINDLGESDQPDGTKALNRATNKRIVTVNGRWRNA